MYKTENLVLSEGGGGVRGLAATGTNYRAEGVHAKCISYLYHKQQDSKSRARTIYLVDFSVVNGFGHRITGEEYFTANNSKVYTHCAINELKFHSGSSRSVADAPFPMLIYAWELSIC